MISKIKLWLWKEKDFQEWVDLETRKSRKEIRKYIQYYSFVFGWLTAVGLILLLGGLGLFLSMGIIAFVLLLDSLNENRLREIYNE